MNADGWRETASSRPGYATWPNTAPGSPSWWDRDVSGPRYTLGARPAPECLTSHPQMHADCDGCSCSCHPLTRFIATAAPRRRWWHRLTRRNP